jgi:RNA polymerase sigma-70 factor (ECF subfamily)
VSTTVTEVLAPPFAAAADDAASLLRALGGDPAAREELARSCQRQAYRFALQLTGRADEARDVAQDAVLRFFASLHRFDPGRPVRPWLLRIVRNLVTDRARRARLRRTEALPTDDVASVLAEPPDPGPDPEARAARRELERALWRGLLDLEPPQREIIALRDYLDLSYDEIATTLRIPLGTVMSRLHRARLALRQRVQARLGVIREVNRG